MRRFAILAAISLALMTALYLAGCNGSGSGAKKNGDKSEEHDHVHPAHGPHGGDLVELGDKEEYHAEWAHDENGKITIWILDGKGEKEVPIAADKVTIVTKDPQGEQSYDLTAVNRTSGDMPTAFQFETESKELLGTLETLGGEVTATLKVDINGKPFEGKIEHHEHRH